MPTTIADKLSEVMETKTAIYNAVNARGGGLTSSSNFEDYPTKILDLPPKELITNVNNYTYTVPETIPELCNYCFFGRTKLVGITFNSVMTKIPSNCFRYDTGLTSITIPDNITLLDTYAFASCTNILEMHIGTGVTNMKSQSLYWNYKRTSGKAARRTVIYINATTPPTIVADTFNTNANNLLNLAIVVPSASLNTYKTASVWSTIADKIYDRNPDEQEEPIPFPS